MRPVLPTRLEPYREQRREMPAHWRVKLPETVGMLANVKDQPLDLVVKASGQIRIGGGIVSSGL